MKNLEIMGVQEMDAREMKIENGGSLGLFIGLCAAAYCAYQVYNMLK